MSEQAQENTKASTKQSALGKWTRRGFISAGALAGGGLIVGVALRLVDSVVAENETVPCHPPAPTPPYFA